MSTYDYSVSANNNNATYSVVLKPYKDGDQKILIKQTLPMTAVGGGANSPPNLYDGVVTVNNATNGTNPINCTLQIKDTSNLYTSAYSTAGNTPIADGVVTSQVEDLGPAAAGASINSQITEDKLNDLLVRIVANWEGILQTDANNSVIPVSSNCPIKNIFLRITV